MKIQVLLFVLVMCFMPFCFAKESEGCFDFSVVQEKARALALAPYEQSKSDLPHALKSLSYDDMRDIRYDPKFALWRMERRPFQLQFFHRGGQQRDSVQVYTIEGEKIQEVLFSKNQFDYGRVKVRGSLRDDLGYAGFRIHYPLNRTDYLDEVLTFQGASYFRALGKGHHYGLSARGAAVNVTGAIPEEFPRFTTFWVKKPDTTSTNLTIYALMNSPSLSGAFEMILNPESDTTMDIKAALYARTPIAQIGIAPLTSMFWYGENSMAHRKDFRPEVHDSDGLLIHEGTEGWIWRPLINEGLIQETAIKTDQLHGFGLLQRDQNFDSYEDLEAFYHQRPSLWVEPTSDWGAGEVRLVELPTDTEYHDNIVALWHPEIPLTPTHPLEYAYRLHWCSEIEQKPALAEVIATRSSQPKEPATSRKFVIDFSNAASAQQEDQALLVPDISASNATILNPVLQYNSFNDSWRVFFDTLPAGNSEPIELRCLLRQSNDPWSETWIYRWIP
jgi:glucans biosynthesis protein